MVFIFVFVVCTFMFRIAAWIFLCCQKRGRARWLVVLVLHDMAALVVFFPGPRLGISIPALCMENEGGGVVLLFCIPCISSRGKLKKHCVAVNEEIKSSRREPSACCITSPLVP